MNIKKIIDVSHPRDAIVQIKISCLDATKILTRHLKNGWKKNDHDKHET